MEQITISEIIAFFKTEDTVKVIELLQKYHDKLLYSTAYGVCQNEEDCKDIVQNVLLKLSKLPIDKFPNSGETSWLYTMIRHEAIDYIKYEKHHVDLSEADGVSKTDQNINELFDLESYESMISSLNEKQREVVTMKVLGEFSHKEIASILGKPIGTIQWIYNTSIGKLRVQLATMMTFFFASIMGILYSGIRKIGKNTTMQDASCETCAPEELESATDSQESSSVETEVAEDSTVEDFLTSEDTTSTNGSTQVLPPVVQEEFVAPFDMILLSSIILFVASFTGIIIFFKKNK